MRKEASHFFTSLPTLASDFCVPSFAKSLIFGDKDLEKPDGHDKGEGKEGKERRKRRERRGRRERRERRERRRERDWTLFLTSFSPFPPFYREIFFICFETFI